jgi:para-aminobenzoate synthetase
VKHRLHTTVHQGAVSPERVFAELYAASMRAFWLERASRFSYLGDDTGPLAEFCRYEARTGVLEVERSGHPVTRLHEQAAKYLRRVLTRRECTPPPLPFDFKCGWVGSASGKWLFTDRVVVIDHAEHKTYLLCLAEDTSSAHAQATMWLDVTCAFLSTLTPHESQPAPARERWLLRDQAAYMMSWKEESHAGDR